MHIKRMGGINCIFAWSIQLKWFPNKNEQIIAKFRIVSITAFSAPRTLNSIYWDFIGPFLVLNSHLSHVITYQNTIHWLVREELQLMHHMSSLLVALICINSIHFSPKWLKMDLSKMKRVHFQQYKYSISMRTENFTIIGTPNKWIVLFAPKIWDTGIVK